MTPQAKLFICEFITGGGFQAVQLPNSLACEGRLMRDALLRDIADLPAWQVTTTHDVRLAPSTWVSTSIAVHADTDIWALWQQCMQQADAVWLIAPETDGVLYRLTELAQQLNKRIIGCGLAAIAVTTSKHTTAQVLTNAKVRAIPTYLFAEWCAAHLDNDSAKQRWVVKPDDGAGCEETYVFNHASEVMAWLAANPKQQATHIIQPYVAGIAASVCVLSAAGKVTLLSCNYQTLTQQQHQLKYTGGLINGALSYAKVLHTLVESIQQAIPDLAGYYGVDVILHEDELNKVTVVEINPRLTTSYVHLREAIGHNPAQLILQAMLQKECVMPQILFKQVAFHVNS